MHEPACPPATRVRAWLAANPRLFVVFGPAGADVITLVELNSNRTLRLDLRALVGAEEDRDTRTGSLYLRLTFEDGRRVALSAVGVVFPPSFDGTGPLPDAPASACFMDYARLLGHLEHLIVDDPARHRQEALQLVLVLLAFLEGARRVGFDVGEDERHLDGLLAQLEAQRE